jgi:hypothetical protein
MLNSGLGALGQRSGDDRPVALGRIALVADKRDGTDELRRKGIEQRPLRGQVLAEIRKVTSEIAIVAQPVANMPGRSERAFVLINNTGSC